MIGSLALVLALIFDTPVTPETVRLDTGAMVALDSFVCSDTPRSSVIERVCYDRARNILVVDKRGSYRGYCDLPLGQYEAFVTAPSMGRFFSQTLENDRRIGRYRCPA